MIINNELIVSLIFNLLFQIDNMKLNYDNVTRTTSNQDGVDIRIPGWGDPFVVEYLDPSKASPGAYFKDVGNMLVDNLGYIRNYSLRGAPYDFRKGPSMFIHISILLKIFALFMFSVYYTTKALFQMKMKNFLIS